MSSFFPWNNSASDQRDGQARHVDADPLAAQLFGGVDRGAAAAERIEHHIALVRRGGNDPLEQRERLRVKRSLVVR